MEPGPFLAGILASIDRDALSGHDQVLLLRAERRQADHYQARVYATMAAVADSAATEVPDLPAELVEDAAAEEIGAALTLTRRSAESQLGFASTLITEFPKLWKALSEGTLDVPRVMVIINQTSQLEPALRQRITDQILESASGLTTGQLRARLAHLVISVAPDAAERRYREGLEERRVVVDANPDGTANLCAWSLPTAQTQAVLRKVNRIARSLNTNGETRTLDQLRADVFLDLLQGRAHGHRRDRGVVDLKVDLTTLAELDDKPAQIPGWGPVIADVARQVAREQADSEWRITITDPEGAPVAVTTTRRRPTAAQRRQVEARNPNCVFPGCRFPSAQSDIDHVHDWADTHQTCTTDLDPLCRHHHVGKHKRGWKLKRIRPGTYQWTSPLGHNYTVGPDPP